mmetsp:Transcript_35791/g.75204  ORF Transcript_35791/g.75204 Transcript_35791/m.75204 type:complete len:533 (-) Transcript_35791:61-1659(-)
MVSTKVPLVQRIARAMPLACPACPVEASAPHRPLPGISAIPADQLSVIQGLLRAEAGRDVTNDCEASQLTSEPNSFGAGLCSGSLQSETLGSQSEALGSQSALQAGEQSGESAGLQSVGCAQCSPGESSLPPLQATERGTTVAEDSWRGLTEVVESECVCTPRLSSESGGEGNGSAEARPSSETDPHLREHLREPLREQLTRTPEGQPEAPASDAGEGGGGRCRVGGVGGAGGTGSNGGEGSEGAAGARGACGHRDTGCAGDAQHSADVPGRNRVGSGGGNSACGKSLWSTAVEGSVAGSPSDATSSSQALRALAESLTNTPHAAAARGAQDQAQRHGAHANPRTAGAACTSSKSAHTGTSSSGTRENAQDGHEQTLSSKQASSVWNNSAGTSHESMDTGGASSFNFPEPRATLRAEASSKHETPLTQSGLPVNSSFAAASASAADNSAGSQKRACPDKVTGPVAAVLSRRDARTKRAKRVKPHAQRSRPAKTARKPAVPSDPIGLQRLDLLAFVKECFCEEVGDASFFTQY